MGRKIQHDQLTTYSGTTEKSSPVTTDLLLIEDSEDSNTKKKVSVGNILGIFSWNYLTNTLPQGVTGEVRALYKFDNTGDELNDRSTSYSNNLSLSTGTNAHSVQDDITGLYFDGSTIYTASGDSSLAITGSITVELLVRTSDPPDGSANAILQYGGDGETEVENTLYLIYQNPNTRQLTYLHEYSSGTNQYSSFTDAAVQEGVPYLISITRDSAGTDVNMYLNGLLAGNYTASYAPTGGTSGTYLTVGANQYPGVTAYFKGTIFSIRIVNAEFSAAQVLASYNVVRGRG